MSKIWGGVGECILFSLNVVGLLHIIKKGPVQDALYRSGVHAGEIINTPPPPPPLLFEYKLPEGIGSRYV